MVEMVGLFSKTPRVLRAVRVEIFIFISTLLTISTLNIKNNPFISLQVL